MLKNILFPGWAIPGYCYNELNPHKIVDYGFFKYADQQHSEYLECGLNALMDNSFPCEILPQQELILTAHSLGTLPAMRAALKCPNVKGLLIISGFSKFTATKDYPFGKPEPGINMMQGMMGFSASMVLSRFYKEMTKPSDFRVPARDKTNNAILKEGLEYLKKWDLRSVLSEISVPTVIIHGTEDAIVDFKLAEFLHENIKGSILQKIEGAGHALPFTHSEQCKNSLTKLKNL